MKPTQEQVIAWAGESGIELYGLGTDRAKFVYYLEAFAALAYAAGRKDENEACAEEADKWQSAIHDPRYECDCATAIRARREQ